MSCAMCPLRMGGGMVRGAVMAHTRTSTTPPLAHWKSLRDGDRKVLFPKALRAV